MTPSYTCSPSSSANETRRAAFWNRPSVGISVGEGGIPHFGEGGIPGAEGGIRDIECGILQLLVDLFAIVWAPTSSGIAGFLAMVRALTLAIALAIWSSTVPTVWVTVLEPTSTAVKSTIPTFSNPGFLAIALTSAVVGEDSLAGAPQLPGANPTVTGGWLFSGSLGAATPF